MSAYSSAQALPNPIQLQADLSSADARFGTAFAGYERSAVQLGASVLDAVIDELAQRVATAVAAQFASPAGNGDDDWLDTRHAAEYLGVHRDTLRKLAAERAVPVEQEGPGCKLFFRRGDLDEWRRAGGRNVHLSSVLADAA